MWTATEKKFAIPFIASTATFVTGLIALALAPAKELRILCASLGSAGVVGMCVVPWLKMRADQWLRVTVPIVNSQSGFHDRLPSLDLEKHHDTGIRRSPC